MYLLYQQLELVVRINDTSAFFTFDGGYLTNIFYHCFRPKLSFQQLKKRILKYYFDDFGENLHRPRFFN